MGAEYSLTAAFLVGLFGGVHCIGMCGGIVGTLGLGLPEPVRARPLATLPYLFLYNAGRVLSYTAAGALMGGIGALAIHWLAIREAQLLLQVVAGLFMIAMGLYLGGWWLGVVKLEKAGGPVWRRIEPLARRVMPVRSPGQAFALGLLWGWLPCGLIYSVLIWAISAGSALQGGLLMLSFGLGTLPNLMAMGLFAAGLSRWLRRPAARYAAGLAVILLGLLTLGQALV